MRFSKVAVAFMALMVASAAAQSTGKGLSNMLPTLTLGTKKVDVPSFNLPNVTLPKLASKHVDIPHHGFVKVPTVTKPDVSLPSIGSKAIEVPTINFTLPNYPKKTIEVPTIILPNSTTLTYPKVDFKKVDLPKGKGSFKVPTVTKPSLTGLPSLGTKKIEILDLSKFMPKMPNFTLPTKKVEVPSFNLPNVTLPKIGSKKIDVPHHGEIEVPTVEGHPSLGKPSLGSKSVEVPDLKAALGQVHSQLPTIGSKKVDVPTISGFPNVTHPKFSMKKIGEVKGKGAIEVPTLSKPSITLPTIGSKSIDVPTINHPKLSGRKML